MNKYNYNVALPQGTSLLGYQLRRPVGKTPKSLVYDAIHSILGVDVRIHEFYVEEHLQRDMTSGAWHIISGHETSAMQDLNQFVSDMRLVSGMRIDGVLPVRHAFAMEELSVYCCVVPQLQPMVVPASVTELSQLLQNGIDCISRLASLGYAPQCISKENMGIGADGALKINLIDNLMLAEQVPAEPVDGYAPIEYSRPGSAAVGIFSALYSFAAVVYATICGQRVPDAELRIAKVDPYKPLALDAQLAKKYTKPLLETIDKALSLWPDDRWHTASDWVNAIQDAETPVPQGKRAAASCPVALPKKDYSADIIYAINSENADVLRSLLWEGASVDSVVAEGGITPLHYSVQRGRLACLQVLLDCGAELEVYNAEGSSALHMAAQLGFDECLLSLLKAGASPNLPHKHNGKTPLMLAVEFGHMSCIEYLMGAGADDSIVCKAGKKAKDYTDSLKLKIKLTWLANFSTPVTVAAATSAKALEKVLKSGAYPDNLDSVSDMTPLMKWAASTRPDKEDAIRMLLAAGALCSTQNSREKTALDYAVDDTTLNLLEESVDTPITVLGAVTNNNPAMLRRMLANGASPDEPRTHTGATPLQVALAEGSSECARLLIEYGACIRMSTRVGANPLTAAASSGLCELISLLLELGLVVDYRSKIGKTPLMVAAAYNQSACINHLLERGAQLETRDDDGWTALMYAASEEAEDAISALIEAGAEVDAMDLEYATPLMQASLGSSVRAVQLLVDARADAEARDAYGKTPLMYAADEGDVAVLRYLYDCGVAICARDNSGNTALHYAANSDCADAVRLLLLAEADVNVKNEDGVTPLMYATAEDSDAETLNVLLSSGVNPNEQDMSGNSALMFCAQRNSPECARTLIAAGSQINMCDKNGNTALMIAAEKGHVDVISVLLSAGADNRLRNRDGRTAAMLAEDKVCRSMLA